MTWLDFATLTLATLGLLRAWQEGALFAAWRERARAWARCGGPRWFVGELLGCSVCQAFHLAFWLAFLFLGAARLLLSPPWPEAATFFLAALAAAGAAHYGWDLRLALIKYCNTPGGGRDDPQA